MDIPQLQSAQNQLSPRLLTERAGADEAAPAHSDTFSRSGRPEPSLIPSPLKTAGAETLAGMEKASSALPSDPKEAAAFLHKFNENLGLSPELLKEKYELMKKDTLSFLRATPALFIQDMKGPYSDSSRLLPRKAPLMTIDGDLHIGNFGTFKDKDGTVTWGLNDQDQAGPGSPEWDLIRLSASLVLLGRQNGLSKDEQDGLVKTLAKKYCRSVKSISEGNVSDSASLAHSETHGAIKKLISKAAESTQKDMLDKYTTSTDPGVCHFKNTSELKAVTPGEKDGVVSSLRDYEKTIDCSSDGVTHPLQVIDVHQKLGSGGSSYGLRRYWVLVNGESAGDRPVILELKQLLTPAVIDHTGDLSKADGLSMVDSQKKLGGYTNPLTGHTRIDGRSYLVREREAAKDTLSLEELTDSEDLDTVTSQTALVVARAHGHTESQAKALSKWIGSDEKLLKEKLIDIATRYADQTEADYRAFKASC
ncbi:MAG: DUF2252 family protein [Candidatus Xenobiia bacterium LiM19]